jgi:hypothetical protein
LRGYRRQVHFEGGPNRGGGDRVQQSLNDKPKKILIKLIFNYGKFYIIKVKPMMLRAPPAFEYAHPTIHGCIRVSFAISKNKTFQKYE